MKSARNLKKALNNAKGFSLVELMIVVAIIGMLAAVGIPQYAKFQAKARQSEAKSNLAGLFNAQKSFQSEWNFYTAALKNAGFGVEGRNLRYITGFETSYINCASTALGYTGPANNTTAAASATWSHGSDSNNVGATWHNLLNFDSALNMLDAGNIGQCTQVTFVGVSIGDPRNTPVTVAPSTSDTWTIDHTKNLTNPVFGVN